MSIKIKTTLPKLTHLFAASAANEELPLPIRRFASQCTILCAHIERVEAKIGTEKESLITELNELLAPLMQQPADAEQEPAAEQTNVVAPPVAAAPSVIIEDEAPEGNETPEQVAARMTAESIAEAAAIEAGTAPIPAPTPVVLAAPRGRANGGKAKPAGGAA